MTVLNPKAETLVAVVVDDGILLQFGWIDRPLPAAGIALLENGAEGSFAAQFWPKADDPAGAHWFATILRFPDPERIRPGRLILTDPERTLGYALPDLRNIRINPWVLLSTLREDLPDALPGVFDLLRRALTPADRPAPSERIVRFLATFLHGIAQHDGFGEIFGRLRGPGILVQGWSSGLIAGRQDVIVETDGYQAFSAIFGTFDRPDLPDEAGGVVGVLPAAEIDPSTIRRIYFRSPRGWRFLELFENRTLLADGIALPHLRDMLSRLQGEPEALRTLRRLATSQYEGVETVSRLEIPVRAALDVAVRVPGAGTFLAGWLLDPMGHITAIELRGSGLNARVDTEWHRTARRDITEGFSQDPQFAAHLAAGRHDHGFVVFAPEPEDAAQDAERYLQISLGDDACAFLPVPTIPPTTEITHRLLSSFDLNDPATDIIIARHIGPIVQAAGRRPGRGSVAATDHLLGRPLPNPRVSVILPVVDGREDIDINLAKFAIDPDFADAEVIVVAGAGAHPGLARALRRFAEFYRLSVRLVAAPHARDAFEAQDAGADAATAEHLLFLSPSVLPTAPGWLGALEWAYRRSGRTGMVSPTLLYEDDSIKFAGIRTAGDRVGGGPGLVSQYAGYPRDWLKGRDLTAVPLGTTDCCLLPRRLYMDLGGFPPDYVGTDFKGLDFCLKLRAAGHACLWLPAVALVAVDEEPRDRTPEYWQQTGGLVDRWTFSRRWSLHLANLSAAGGTDR